MAQETSSIRNRLLRAMLQWTVDVVLRFPLAAGCVLPTAYRLGPGGRPRGRPCGPRPQLTISLQSFSGAIAQPNQLSERHRASKEC